MPVLDRDALAESPLADLHLLASELGVDGYRRLRKEQLVEAILARQAGEEPPAGDDAEPAAEEPERAPRRRRSSRRRRTTADAEEAGEAGPEADDPSAPAVAADPGTADPAEDATLEGVVEVLGNGSAFLRVSPPDASEGDAYVSAAQVRRCELVSGDRVAGPVRAPRRSERYPSLIRVETINGRPADEVAEGTRWEDLPAAFPSERFRLGSEDPTVKAMEWLTPFGRGSRVVIAGPARAGKSEALRRLALELPEGEAERIVVLAGVRPEEATEWADGPLEPMAAHGLGTSSDVLGQAVERAVDQGRRVAARGGDAVVLVDGLDALPPAVARKALAAARNVRDGGSLTVIATASEPLGGETTVIALDAALVAVGSFPAVDLVRSGTLRPEELVGEAGAQAIRQARAEVAGQGA